MQITIKSCCRAFFSTLALLSVGSGCIEHLVQERIATGRFQSADEVLVEALETLRDVDRLAEPVREELRQRLTGAGKGHSLPLDRAAFFAEARRRLEAE